MYFNIYVIYHSDIYRKRHIDNIINKLFYQPYIEFIYSNLHKKDIVDTSLQHMSINEIAEVLDHYHIWSRIASSNNDNVINLIIDDSVNLNNKIINIVKYMNDIIDELLNNKTCIDWNILFLYELNYTTDFNEIQITDNIVSPNNKRISHKCYFITHKTAKLLNSIKSINMTISKFFTNLLYDNDYSFHHCWQLFALKKPVFIEDNKNQDIVNYIYYYNDIQKPYNVTIQTLQKKIITKYLTIFFFVEKYKEYHYFKRIYNYLTSFGFHIIPIYYDDISNKYKLFLYEFSNLHTDNNENHYIIISSTIYFIMNINIDSLLNFYDTLNCDIIYSHNLVNNQSNLLEKLWINKISITKYNHIYNIINNKSINTITSIYNNNNDLFFNIENNQRQIKLKYHNDYKNFYYKDHNNTETYPLFIYSLNYNILIDDILNIHPYRGKIIHNTAYSSTFYRTNKLLILVYINDYLYNIIGNKFEKLIHNYKNRFILPTSIVDIDVLLYTDDISLYDTISYNYKIKIDYVVDFRKYYISTLQYAETTYRFIFITTAYHELSNIYTLFDLIYANQAIIVPLICGNKYNKKVLSISGVIDRLVNRVELGLWVIPNMKDTYLLNANIYSDIILWMTRNLEYNNEIFDDYLIRCIRFCNIPIYCSNIRIYGIDIRI
jgi:hypothetical protein